jgi:hypothetical protein
VTYQRPSNAGTNALPTPSNGLATLSPIPPGALERAPSWKGRSRRPQGATIEGKAPMPDARNELNRIMPAILSALSDQRRPGRPIKVALAPSGHIEAIVTLCDDGARAPRIRSARRFGH